MTPTTQPGPCAALDLTGQDAGQELHWRKEAVLAGWRIRLERWPSSAGNEHLLGWCVGDPDGPFAPQTHDLTAAERAQVAADASAAFGFEVRLATWALLRTDPLKFGFKRLEVQAPAPEVSMTTATKARKPTGNGNGQHGSDLAREALASARLDGETQVVPTPPRFELLPIGAVDPWSGNPRKHFDPAALAELTDSVRSKGVLEPILVRPAICDVERGPMKGRHERYLIVAGERRYRAAKAAGLVEIPALVQDLDDRAALEIAVVENEQRADVGPLERAEGYARLLEQGVSLEDLAARVGKGVSTIRGLLKLRQLPEQARKLVESGDLSPSAAEVIARIPNDKLRKEAASELLRKDHWTGELPSCRRIEEEVHRRWMIELKQAPFGLGDKALVPDAGSCKDCPKRTGNNRAEYPDGRADVCTDPPCYERKVKAHGDRLEAEARAEGGTVISGEDREKALNGGIGTHGRSKWLDLDVEHYDTTGNRKVGVRLKGDPILEQAALLRDERGVMHRVVPRKAALEILAGQDTTRVEARKLAESRKVSRVPPDWQIEERVEAMAVKAVGEMGLANFEDLDPLAAQGGPDTNASYEALRYVAWTWAMHEADIIGRLEECPALARRLELREDHPDDRLGMEDYAAAIKDWTGKATPRELLALCLELAVGTAANLGNHAEMLRQELYAFGDVDLKALTKQARRDLTEEARAKSKAAKGGVKVTHVMLANGPATIVSHPNIKVPGQVIERDLERVLAAESDADAATAQPSEVQAPAPKPYAWDVTINRHGDEDPATVTVVAPTEAQARRKAMLKSRAREVLKLESMTEEQYRPRQPEGQGVIDLQLTEEERQTTLLALGELAARRPGWDHFLAAIADKLHGREMYESFQRLSADSNRPLPSKART